ncbi:MAG: hypothetical protein ACKVS9_16320 [Phycisphaerae bacterium]
MSDSAATPNVLDPSGIVSGDCPCRRCGYNLRGLHGDNRCPECGTAIGLSVLGDLLRFADVAWLRQLILGLRFIFAGIVAAVVLNYACVQILTRGANGLANLIDAAGALVLLGGAWIVTMPDPSGLGEAQYGRVRKFIRGTLLLNAIAVVADTFTSTAVSLPARLSHLNDVLQFVSLLFLLVGCAALFRYLASLAMRAPDPSLARNLRRVSWMLVALITLPIVILLIGLATAFSQLGGGATVAAGGVTYTTSQASTTTAATTTPAAPPTGTVRISYGGTTTVITNPAASPVLSSLILVVSTLSILVGLLALFTFVAIVVAFVRFQRCIAKQAELARRLPESA